MKELFQNKVFRIVMVTDIIQQLGIWVRNIAVLFFVIEKTQADPVAVSLISVAEYLPMFVFAYIGGTLADRWNPKHTMIWGDYLSAFSVGAVFLAITLGAWQGIFLVTFLSTVVTQFSVPSSAILFKRFIPGEQVNAAISLSQAQMSLFLIVGPILGTLFYTTLGWGFSLGLIGGLFLLSATVQFLLPSVPRNPERRTAGIVGEMKEGIGFLRENRAIMMLLGLLCLFCFGQGLLQPLTVFVLDQQLGLGKEALQWFFALAGGGLLIDTPGMREIQLWGDESGVQQTFRDIEALAVQCRFHDCQHGAEPGCAVRAALDTGELDAGRFQSYQKLQRELRYLAMRQDEGARSVERKRWRQIHKEARRLRKWEERHGR